MRRAFGDRVVHYSVQDQIGPKTGLIGLDWVDSVHLGSCVWPCSVFGLVSIGVGMDRTVDQINVRVFIFWANGLLPLALCFTVLLLPH